MPLYNVAMKDLNIQIHIYSCNILLSNLIIILVFLLLLLLLLFFDVQVERKAEYINHPLCIWSYFLNKRKQIHLLSSSISTLRKIKSPSSTPFTSSPFELIIFSLTAGAGASPVTTWVIVIVSLYQFKNEPKRKENKKK